MTLTCDHPFLAITHCRGIRLAKLDQLGLSRHLLEFSRYLVFPVLAVTLDPVAVAGNPIAGRRTVLLEECLQRHHDISAILERGARHPPLR